MVHLNSVATDEHAHAPVVEGLDKLSFFPDDGESDLSASVYGSRFASEDLPKHEMPEREMPKEVAYRMIKDDLTYV